MRCIKCGCELPEGSKFCFNCGEKQPEIVEETVEKTVGESVAETVEEAEETVEEIVEEAVEEAEEQIVEEISEEIEAEETAESKEEEMPTEEKVSEEDQAVNHKFCPYCGARNDGDAVFCCACGNNMDMISTAVTAPVQNPSYVPKKKFPFKLVAGAAGAAILILAVVGVGKVMFGGEHKYVAYLKNGHVTQVDVEHLKKDPMVFDGYYSDMERNVTTYTKARYSKDGKYIVYPTEISYDGNHNYPEFRLNMQKISAKEEPKKIDSSVWRYTLLKNNKLVYIKTGNDTLYLNDIKDNKQKIASDVVEYHIDNEEENIVWVESDGGLYSIYQQDLALKKEKKKLAKDVDSYQISKDLKQIAVMEEDTLFLVKDFKEKEKIASDVASFISNAADAGAVFYSKLPEDMVKGSDIIEDDCAEEDAGIKEPEYDDFVSERVEKNEYTGKYEKVEGLDREAYDRAREEYYAKERRDEIRSNLKDLEVGTYVSELYCFKDGEETLVDGAFSSVLYDKGHTAGTKGVFVFNHYNMENVPKIKLSEIESAYKIEEVYLESLKEAAETCVYANGEITVLEETFSNTVALDADKNIGYALKEESTEEDEEEIYTLLSFKTDGKSDGSCKTVADDVDFIQTVIDGNIYYMSDMDEGTGELYCNDKNIDSDVFEGMLVEKDGTIIYAVDYDDAKSRATLKLYNGKKSTTVADDVHAYQFFDDKSIMVLVDFDIKDMEGELKYYNGKDELTDIDEDVTALFGGTTFY